ncbi:MAG: protein kinase [Prevotella sp.]|nr:protein kinase [Prevotella sp.]
MSNTYQVVDRCDFKPGDVVDNRYTVRKSLGDGSFGVVYLIDDGQGEKYALKLLRLWEVPAEIRQPLMERFEMEFKTGQIDCDNLVRSLNYGVVGGNPYIVMEYCPGGDLEPYLGKPDNRTLQICQDILVGLNALHDRGKVHRDLKPENVLFKQNGKAALTDFGISGDRTHRMTQRNIFGKPNQVFGTYAYMPPEQATRARGGATVLPTTDIFSFGVLTYQLLTGALPFGTLESHNDLAIYQKNGADGNWNRSALLAIPDGQKWQQLIEGCLMPDFKERLQNVREVLKLLPRSVDMPNRPQPVMQAPSYMPQAQTRGYMLRILQGEEYGKLYNLTQMVNNGRRILTIGRQTGNMIFVKSDFSDFMSRFHCTIEAETSMGRWLIRDGQWHQESRQWQNSSNGTYINSSPITNNGFYLKAGDIITMGDVTMRFENY